MQSRRTASGVDASVIQTSSTSRASKVAAWPNGLPWQADGPPHSNHHLHT